MGLATVLWAQRPQEIDSLERLVQSRRATDETRLAAHIALAKLYLNINERRALEHARQALPIAQRLKDVRKQALSLYYQASALYYLRLYESSGRFLMQAESLLAYLPADTAIRIQVLNLHATLAEQQGEFLQAKSYYEQALERARLSSDRRLYAMTLINLAELHLGMRLYELAEEAAQEALRAAEATYEKDYVRNALKTLAFVYVKQGRVEEAMALYRRIIALGREVGILEWVQDGYGFAIVQAAQMGLASVDSLLRAAEADLAEKAPILWAKLLNWVASEGFYEVGSLARAKDLYQKALALAEKQDSILAIRVLLNLANLYSRQALYPQAMELLSRARELSEQKGDSALLPMVLTAIGEVYFAQEEWRKAAESFNKAADFAYLAEDPAFPFRIATNLAAVQAKLGNPDAARNLFQESLLLAAEMEDWEAATNACLNLARLEIEQGRLDSALSALQRAEKYAQKVRNPFPLANILLMRGELLAGAGRLPQAVAAYERARALLESLEAYSELAQVYEQLIRLYGRLGQYQKAYPLVFPLIEAIKRTSNEENVRALTRMELEYLHQKEKDAQERQIEAEKLRAEKARQVTWVIIVSAGIVLGAAGVVLLVLYRANRREREINVQLAERNRLIESQKQLLEEKNEALERAKRDIEESILYARRIQLAILPDLKPFQERFPDAFVLYLPRDVVSGDFYYYYPLSDHESLLAVADCTGHGVPGAFMSMIGSTLLNRLAQEEGPKDPAFLLQRLDEELRATLHQALSQDQVKDGMDIGLCYLDERRGQLHFAGARRPLFVFTPEGEFIELKGSRRSIGGDVLQQQIPFEGYTLPLQAGLSFYLFSDGLVDQFGWEQVPGKPPRRTKFLARRLRQLLERIRCLPAAEQKAIIEKVIYDWRADIEQLDDICIVGVRYGG